MIQNVLSETRQIKLSFVPLFAIQFRRGHFKVNNMPKLITDVKSYKFIDQGASIRLFWIVYQK
jgi:hypothetical protein